MNYEHNKYEQFQPLGPHQGDEGELVRIDALVRLTDAINAGSDVNRILKEIAEESARLCGTRKSSVYLYTDEGKLDRTLNFGLPKPFALEVEKLGRTQWAVGESMQVGAPVTSRITTRGPYASPLHKLAAANGITALVAAPMCYQGRVLGVLLLYREAKSELSASQMNDLHLMANLGALALAHARLVETRKWEQKAQDQFLDALSHELRTPLTSIMGFAQLIRKRLALARETDSRVLEQLDLLWAQAQRLRRLLDAFSDMTNIERGEFIIERERVDVAAVLREAVVQTTAQASTKHVISVEAPDRPVWLLGDAKRLEHVFIQLISNAIRYSPVDKPIAVTLQGLKGGDVAISIVDRGPGVPSDLQSEIFKRFYPSDARKTGGMGLGLYFSRAIIEAHGGKLSIDAAPGAGTVVSVALPGD